MERFTGWGVMGLPFDSGHVLGLRCWATSTVGPPYTSVWHRSPDGRWAFWSTETAEVSCTRYTSAIADEARVSRIQVSWSGARLLVEVDEPSLRWELDVRPTALTTALSVAARLVPPRRALLRAMGPVAGRALGTGPLALVGRMPNGQAYRLVPSAVRRVVSSTAVLDGADLGTPSPLAAQARIGDFRIPQRGIVADGAVDFVSPRPGASSAPRC